MPEEGDPLTEEPISRLIDYRLLRLVVGAVGLSLGTLTSFVAKASSGADLTSISASYHTGARDFFVGCLCFIGAFLTVYRGYNRVEAALSKIAGLSAIIVAFVPTAADPGDSSPLHYSAAAVVFLILTYFCLFSFRKRAKNKTGSAPRIRAWIYGICGVSMLACIVVMFLHSQFGLLDYPRTVFWGETIALVAFGIAWIIAGKFLIAKPSERMRPGDFVC